jgi:hypothetical protein
MQDNRGSRFGAQDFFHTLWTSLNDNLGGIFVGGAFLNNFY